VPQCVGDLYEVPAGVVIVMCFLTRLIDGHDLAVQGVEDKALAAAIVENRFGAAVLGVVDADSLRFEKVLFKAVKIPSQ